MQSIKMTTAARGMIVSVAGSVVVVVVIAWSCVWRVMWCINSRKIENTKSGKVDNAFVCTFWRERVFPPRTCHNDIKFLNNALGG